MLSDMDPDAYRWCLLCKKIDNNRLHSIKYAPRVKEDILYIFGESVTNTIQDYNEICISCMHILQMIEEYKRLTTKAILENMVTRQNISIHKPKLWTLLCDNIFIKEQELLVPLYSVPIDAEAKNYIYSEESWKYTESQYNKGDYFDSAMSNSGGSMRSMTPYLDREIETYTKRPFSRSRSESRSRSRKRGYNWARKKQRRKSSRSQSNHSRSSRASRFRSSSPNSDTESCASHVKLRYNTQGNLMNKITRCVSRLQDEEIQTVSTNFLCEDQMCSASFTNINDLTKHEVDVHGKLALFHCYECRKTYTKLEHVSIHKEFEHFDNESICCYCRLKLETTKEAQQHIREHLIHSVPCIYCDLQFLQGSALLEHIKAEHKGKKKRVRPVKTRILYRICKDDSKEDRGDERDDAESVTSKGKTYKAIFLNRNTDDNSRSNNVESDTELAEDVESFRENANKSVTSVSSESQDLFSKQSVLEND